MRLGIRTAESIGGETDMEEALFWDGNRASLWWERPFSEWYPNDVKIFHMPILRTVALGGNFALAVCAFMTCAEICSQGVLATLACTSVLTTIYAFYAVITDHEGFFPPTWSYAKAQEVNDFWCFLFLYYNIVVLALVLFVSFLGLFYNCMAAKDFWQIECETHTSGHSFIHG